MLDAAIFCCCRVTVGVFFCSVYWLRSLGLINRGSELLMKMELLLWVCSLLADRAGAVADFGLEDCSSLQSPDVMLPMVCYAV